MESGEGPLGTRATASGNSISDLIILCGLSTRRETETARCGLRGALVAWSVEYCGCPTHQAARFWSMDRRSVHEESVHDEKVLRATDSRKYTHTLRPETPTPAGESWDPTQ